MSKEGALLVRRDGDEPQEWPLRGPVWIGRDAGCDVCLPDRQVSRRHAVVQPTGDGYVVEDQSSKNGTWVNGEPVAGTRTLVDGDELTIAARYKLYFVDAEATAPLVFEGRGLRIDPATLSVYVNGEQLDPPLSGLQYELLSLLVRANGALVSRDDIVREIWPEADPEGVSEDALDALVRRLRMRLEEVDPEHPYIVTLRGYGYRLNSP